MFAKVLYHLTVNLAIDENQTQLASMHDMQERKVSMEF
jgi:hypothetical protein